MPKLRGTFVIHAVERLEPKPRTPQVYIRYATRQIRRWREVGTPLAGIMVQSWEHVRAIQERRL